MKHRQTIYIRISGPDDQQAWYLLIGWLGEEPLTVFVTTRYPYSFGVTSRISTNNSGNATKVMFVDKPYLFLSTV